MQASSNPVCGTLCSRVLKLSTLLILTFYWFGFQPYRCKRQPLSVCPVSNILRLFHAICCFCLTKESQLLYEKLAIGLSKFAQGSYASWKPLETYEFLSTRPWKFLKFFFSHSFWSLKVLEFYLRNIFKPPQNFGKYQFWSYQDKISIEKAHYCRNIFIVYLKRVLKVIKLGPLKSKNAVLESSWIVLKF